PGHPPARRAVLSKPEITTVAAEASHGQPLPEAAPTSSAISPATPLRRRGRLIGNLSRGVGATLTGIPPPDPGLQANSAEKNALSSSSPPPRAAFAGSVPWPRGVSRPVPAGIRPGRTAARL